MDARRLYLAEGYSSLFTYCTQALHLSEHAAYGRIETARAARRFPVVMGFLADASFNVTTIGLLGPHLTDDNHRTILVSARYQASAMWNALSPRSVHCQRFRRVCGSCPRPSDRPAHGTGRARRPTQCSYEVTTWNCVAIGNTPRSSPHPRRRARPLSRRWHRHGIASRSQSPRKRMTTSAVPRICCDTRSQVGIRR